MAALLMLLHRQPEALKNDRLNIVHLQAGVQGMFEARKAVLCAEQLEQCDAGSESELKMLPAGAAARSVSFSELPSSCVVRIAASLASTRDILALRASCTYARECLGAAEWARMLLRISPAPLWTPQTLSANEECAALLF